MTSHTLSQTKRCKLPVLLGLLFTIGSVSLLGRPGPVSAQTAEASPTAAGAVSVVAAGLTNPRGFDFAPDGSLTVALAGTSGMTAGVASITDGCPTPLVEGLPSYRIVFRAPTGVADVAWRDGHLYLLLAGGNIDGDGMPNGLYRLDDGGEIRMVANISTFIRDNPVAEKPRDYDTDGQPYALLPTADGFWVTEGNSNQVLQLGLDGAVSRVADLSAGHPIPAGIARAAADRAYVGYFTPIPYRDGAAEVVEVAADGTVSVVWTGLTLVTALANGPDGSLYALEMATGIAPDDPSSIASGSGRVVRLEADGSIAPMVTGLPLPVAMAFGPDGALYVAGPTFGADEGQGSILRIDLPAEGAIAVMTNDLPGPDCS